jgi:hypothetical protein
VTWCGLLNPQLRNLEILQLDLQGRYIHVLGATADSRRRFQFEGLTLDLASLWALWVDDRL